MDTKELRSIIFSRKHYLFLAGFACFVLLFLFSYSIKKGGFKSTDFAFTVKLQDAIDKSPRLRLANLVGDVMEGSTFMASPEVSIGVVLLLSGFLAIDMKNKRIRFRALCIPVLFTLLVAVEVFGKSVVHHPAPPFFMIKNPTTIFPKYYINDEYSYPSGHAARALFMAFGIAYLLSRMSFMKKREGKIIGVGLLGFYVVLVCISRVYLGHHWLSDIIGGLLVGGGFGLLMFAIFHE